MADLPGGRWRTLLWTAVLALLVGLAWGTALRGGFQYDDLPNLLNDPATRGGEALIARLAEGIRPLTRLSHVLDFALWGDDASGWLLGNLLLHLATVAGVLMLASAYLGGLRAGWLAAAVFALQPAHGMTVAYASGRAAGLMAALLVAALLAHERALRSGVSRAGWEGLALTCFALACLAKETALCFPLLLLLWEASRGTSVELSAIWRRVAPFAAMSVGVLLAIAANSRYQVLLHYSTTLRLPWVSLRHNIDALPETMSLLVRPWDLSVAHPPPRSGPAAALWLVLAWALWRRRFWMLLVWPVAVLLPSHSFIAKADAISESGLYLCWLGPSLAIGAMLDRCLRNPGPWRSMLIALGLAVLVGLCHWRAHIWSDSVRLWHEAARRDPASVRVWNNLGVAHMARGQDAEARVAFDTALRLDPRNVRALTNRQLLDLVN